VPFTDKNDEKLSKAAAVKISLRFLALPICRADLSRGIKAAASRNMRADRRHDRIFGGHFESRALAKVRSAPCTNLLINRAVSMRDMISIFFPVFFFFFFFFETEQHRRKCQMRGKKKKEHKFRCSGRYDVTS